MKRVFKQSVTNALSLFLKSSYRFSNSVVTIRPEVEEKIMYILKLSPKCEISKISPQAKFTDLGFDSLDVVELIVAFEENLGFDLPNEVAENKIETVKDALEQFSLHYPKPNEQ